MGAEPRPVLADEGWLRRLWRLGLQYLRFGLVGLLATLVHVASFSALLELFEIMAWIANVLAFSLAVFVSFLGHFHWTFRRARGSAAVTPAERRGAFTRFAVTATLGLGLNTLAAYLIVDLAGQPYLWAVLVMLLAVPPVIFLVAKFWAFR